jgi:hypothetical protein
MNYKYLTETTLAKIDNDGLSRLSCSIENPEFQAWLSEGNTPLPADIPDPQLQINADALDYLASTDWYCVRFIDSGVAIPDDIKKLRELSRNAII